MTKNLNSAFLFHIYFSVYFWLNKILNVGNIVFLKFQNLGLYWSRGRSSCSSAITEPRFDFALWHHSVSNRITYDVNGGNSTEWRTTLRIGRIPGPWRRFSQPREDNSTVSHSSFVISGFGNSSSKNKVWRQMDRRGRRYYSETHLYFYFSKWFVDVYFLAVRFHPLLATHKVYLNIVLCCISIMINNPL